MTDASYSDLSSGTPQAFQNTWNQRFSEMENDLGTLLSSSTPSEIVVVKPPAPPCSRPAPPSSGGARKAVCALLVFLGVALLVYGLVLLLAPARCDGRAAMGAPHVQKLAAPPAPAAAPSAPAGRIAELKGPDAVLPVAPVVVVFFHATWCGHCKQMHPKFEELASSGHGAGKVQYASLEASELQNAKDPKLTAVQVPGFPTFALFKNGVLADTMVGAQPLEKLKDAIGKLLD